MAVCSADSSAVGVGAGGVSVGSAMTYTTAGEALAGAGVGRVHQIAAATARDSTTPPMIEPRITHGAKALIILGCSFFLAIVE